MWRVLGKLAQSVVSDTCFLNCESVLHQQRRVITMYCACNTNNLKICLQSTFILKRRNAVPLSKKGENPKRLKAKHFIYDLVKNENKEKQPDIEVILTSYVDGLGNISERVLVNPTVAYNELLLPGLAVYATPENVEKYRNYEIKEGEVRYSSKMARTVNIAYDFSLTHKYTALHFVDDANTGESIFISNNEYGKSLDVTTLACKHVFS